MPEWNDGSGCYGWPHDEAGTRPRVGHPDVPRLNLARVRDAPPDTGSAMSGRGMSYAADGLRGRPSSAAVLSWDRADMSGPAGDGGFGGPGGGFAPALPGPPGSSGSAAAGLWGLAPSESLYGADDSAWVDGRSSPHAALRPDVIASHQSAWGHMSEGERADAARYYARLSGLYTERLGMVRGWTRRGARIAALEASYPSSVGVTASTTFAAGLRDDTVICMGGARGCSSARAHSAPGTCPLPPRDLRPAGTFRRREGASSASRVASALTTRPAGAAVLLRLSLVVRPVSNTAGTPRPHSRPTSCSTPRSMRFDSPAIASLASAGYIQSGTAADATRDAGPLAGTVSGPAAIGTHALRSSLQSARLSPSFQLLDGAGALGWVARTGPPSSPRGRLLTGSPAGRHANGEPRKPLAPTVGVRARQASARAGIDGNGAIRMRVAALPPAMPPDPGRSAGWHTYIG